jgi:hypothetical protein
VHKESRSSRTKGGGFDLGLGWMPIGSARPGYALGEDEDS